MAVDVFYDALILIGEYDLSADQNEVKVDRKVDMKENTRFGHTEHRFLPALQELDVDGKGFVSYDDASTPKAVDANISALIGSTAKALTIAPSNTDGAYATIGQIVAAEYNRTLNVSELGEFTFKARCAGQVTRGRLVLPMASRTASAVSTIYQLGALSALQKVIATLHVSEFDGTSLDVLVKSNDTNNTTTPTTRITFAQATAPTSEIKTVAGAITDQYWYVDFTFVGTSVKFAVAFGVR